MLQDKKWEMFAQAMFRGMKHSEAYVAAGYKEDQRNSARFAKHSKILGRIKELDQAAVDRCIIDKVWVIDELVAVVHQARNPKKPNLAAANKALELIGTEFHMFTKRTVNIRLEDMSETELIEFLGGEPSGDEYQHAIRTLASARPAGTA